LLFFFFHIPVSSLFSSFPTREAGDVRKNRGPNHRSICPTLTPHVVSFSADASPIEVGICTGPFSLVLFSSTPSLFCFGESMGGWRSSVEAMFAPFPLETSPLLLPFERRFYAETTGFILFFPISQLLGALVILLLHPSMCRAFLSSFLKALTFSTHFLFTTLTFRKFRRTVPLVRFIVVYPLRLDPFLATTRSFPSPPLSKQ